MEQVIHVVLNIHCLVLILTLKLVHCYLKFYFLKSKDYLLVFLVSPMTLPNKLFPVFIDMFINIS